MDAGAMGRNLEFPYVENYKRNTCSIFRITFAGTLDVFKSLSPIGERKPNSSLARVQEDQRRLLKMWLSNDDNTLED
jgi:hypothetical protein